MAPVVPPEELLEVAAEPLELLPAVPEAVPDVEEVDEPGVVDAESTRNKVKTAPPPSVRSVSESTSPSCPPVLAEGSVPARIAVPFNQA